MSTTLVEVAETIYEAATDGTEKLRYPTSQEAADLIESRKETDDIAFKKTMTKWIE